MNIQYFKNSTGCTILTHQAQDADFVWLDCAREEVIADPTAWQNSLHQHCALSLDELHLTDILNQQHPSFFDLTNDYEILIFRKLLNAAQGLSTTPITFIWTERALITVRDADSHIFSLVHQRISQQLDAVQKNRIPAYHLGE